MAADPDLAHQRPPVTRDRVFRAAIAVADEGGIECLTMRNVADALDVEPMSLYYHVANKAAILDGAVEAVVEEIQLEVSEAGLPGGPSAWKSALRGRILIARNVMLRHRWAPEVIASRTDIGPATMRYFDAVLGHLRTGGFSYDLAHHAMHALGSRALGFTQELFEPEDTDAAEEETMAALARMADELPHLTGMMMEVAHDDPASTIGWCDDQVEFEFALDLILDGLERVQT